MGAGPTTTRADDNTPSLDVDTRHFESRLVLTHRLDVSDEEYRQLPNKLPVKTGSLLLPTKTNDWFSAQDVARIEFLLLDTLNHHQASQNRDQKTPPKEGERSLLVARLSSAKAEPQSFLRLLSSSQEDANDDEVVQVHVELTYRILGVCQGAGCAEALQEEHQDDILMTLGFLSGSSSHPAAAPRQDDPATNHAARRLRGQGLGLVEVEGLGLEEAESSMTSNSGYRDLQEALVRRAQLLLSRQQHSHHATPKGGSCDGHRKESSACLQKKKRSTWDLLQDITSIQPSKRKHRNLQNEEEDLIDVVEVVCDPLVQQLETAVAIDLPGDWSALIQSNRTLATGDVNVTMTASALLEGAFVRTFNHIIFPLCDWPHFRKVWGAEPLTTAFDPFGNVTSVTFEVLAECRNCGYGTPLFHSYNDTNTTAVLIPLSTSTVRTRPSSLVRQEFGLTNEGCLCPRPDDTTEFRAPTFDEFVGAFMSEVAKIHLPPVDDMELQEVPCTSDVTEFTTYVYVDFQMNRSSDFLTLSEQDRMVLENSFKNLYNQLSFQSCDPYFRSVSEAQLELNTNTALVRRRLQQQLDLNLAFVGNSTNTSNYNQTTAVPPHKNPNHTSTPLLRATTGSIFAVTGQCRGCPVTSKGNFLLFDDTIRRRSLLSDDNHQNALPLAVLERNLQGGSSLCLCPPAGQRIEDLSKADFLNYFDEEVAQLQYDGVLETVTGVENLQEGQDVDCAEEVRTFTTTVFVDISVNIDKIGLSLMLGWRSKMPHHGTMAEGFKKCH
ncbi:expressed unknown protein [Seminavis robusta]|uniref:Uncharacterized protein n=1 Tax=Seminavis robusta TaxID=568900 RepID=A0A9N8H5F8_9STRA|nr:expressed unknown protein [Seminavis robusta]|eukprot:Sro113_g055900.1 n/a (777) ;mRNA; r:3988-6403